ncbi:MAG: 5-formyltetrahydrofolate cyclo-ligase [Acidobacteriota bacterium]
MKKSELRQRFLLRQRSISPQERVDKSEAISDHFFETLDLRAVSFLHLFLPISKFNEIDTGPIIRRVWSEYPHIQIIVPRVDLEANEIRSLKYGPDTELEKSTWDIDEPIHNEFVDAVDIDIVLVPGLCFDLSGHRVGYGKGFYDRFLKTCRADCAKVGLSYFEPIALIHDSHDGDVQLDLVITPNKVIHPV